MVFRKRTNLKPPKKWFERCINAVKDKTKSPERLCGYIFYHGTKPKTQKEIIREAEKLNYDLPEPKDYHIEAEDIVIRLVPEIDNLMEIALYLNSETYQKIKEILIKNNIRYEQIDKNYIARRGRKEKATNIFIINNH
ncbi:MAG: hypothetical protein QXF15_03590 [Candidatus Aenigmatarchaeota archaeon]